MHVPVSATPLSTSLFSKQQWTLAFQTITRWTRFLLETWADWFVQRTTDIEKEMRGKQTTLHRGFHSIFEEHLGPLAAPAVNLSHVADRLGN